MHRDDHCAHRQSPRQKVIPETNLCLAASLRTQSSPDYYGLISWMLIGRLSMVNGNKWRDSPGVYYIYNINVRNTEEAV